MAAPKPSVEKAIDNLWQYQLRREHSALLDTLEAERARWQGFTAEARAAQERLEGEITSMKAELFRISNEGEKRAQNIKHDLSIVEAKASEMERLRQDLRALSERVNDLERVHIMRDQVSAVKEHLQATTKTPSSYAFSDAHDARAGTSSRVSSVSARRQHSRRMIDYSKHRTVTPSGPRLTKLQRQAMKEAQALLSETQLPVSSQPPRQIEQDKMPLQKFVYQIDKLAGTTAPGHQNQLASIFIEGLARREDQDAMIEVLSTKAMAKVSGEGMVEILCSWNEMKEALVGAGLLQAPRRSLRRHSQDKQE